jgi:TATA-box binding protein (TBP) (component of TFIID and TFIIIB)
VEARELWTVYMGLLHDIGYLCTGSEDFKIQNIVAKYRFLHAIDLKHLATLNNLEYEQELFPAVRYRLDDLKITINIFRTGTCIILGGKSIPCINLASERLTALLRWSA